MSDFYYNGRLASEFGLVVESVPHRRGGKKRVETVTVPGRFGTLTLKQPRIAFENATQTYQVYFRAPRGGATAETHRIFQWLQSAEGLAKLTDTYDPYVFRMARYVAAPDAEIIFQRFGRMEITFECDARNFLLTGENKTEFTENGTILNNHMESHPLIVITAAGAGTVTVNGTTITVIAEPPEALEVDCENEEIGNSGVSLAHYVDLTEFPVLKTGENEVKMTGAVFKVEITPRWWLP